MHGDFNQAGKQYETLAVADDPGHYQMLIGEGAKFFEDLQKHFCNKWSGDLQSPEFRGGQLLSIVCGRFYIKSGEWPIMLNICAGQYHRRSK